MIFFFFAFNKKKRSLKRYFPIYIVKDISFTFIPGVVALTYLTYRCMKRMNTEKDLLKRMKWINKQLGVKEILIIDSDDDWPMVLSRLKSELSQFKVSKIFLCISVHCN